MQQDLSLVMVYRIQGNGFERYYPDAELNHIHSSNRMLSETGCSHDVDTHKSAKVKSAKEVFNGVISTDITRNK